MHGGVALIRRGEAGGDPWLVDERGRIEADVAADHEVGGAAFGPRLDEGAAQAPGQGAAGAHAGVDVEKNGHKVVLAPGGAGP